LVVVVVQVPKGQLSNAVAVVVAAVLQLLPLTQTPQLLQ
jgi:hypothetical protein